MKAISSFVYSVFLSSLLVYSQTTNTHNLTQSSPAAVPIYRICSGGGYTSGVFRATSRNGLEVKAAFRQFLIQKYSYQTTDTSGMDIICSDVNTEAEAQQVRRNYLSGGKVIDTGWTYDPGAAVQSQPAGNPNAQAPPQNALPTGTPVTVRMLDAIDSNRAGSGAHYRASVTQPVNANGVTLARNADASVALLQTPGGWATQLTSVTINGQPVQVTSNSATVTFAPHSAASNAANKVGSVLGGFGRKAPAPAAVAAVASGQHVLLPPGTELRFVVSLEPPSGSIAASAPGAPAPVQANAAVQPAAPAPSTGHASAAGAVPNGAPAAVQMYCHAVSTQTTPITLYVSPVFSWSSADPTHDSTNAWSEYLTKKYPGVRFDSRVQCVAPSSQGIQQDRAQYIAQSKFRVVNVDWQP